MSDKLNLRQRRIAVMKAVDYVKRGTSDKGTGVNRDVVVSEVRAKLLEHGIDISTSQVGPGRYLETGKASSSGTPLCQYVAMYATTFVNADDPNDTLTIQHEGQGNDFGDKAPGKAATYAEKLNLVKGLMLETGIADESRNPGEGDDGATDISISEIKDELASIESIEALRKVVTELMAKAKKAGDSKLHEAIKTEGAVRAKQLGDELRQRPQAKAPADPPPVTENQDADPPPAAETPRKPAKSEKPKAPAKDEPKGDPPSAGYLAHVKSKLKVAGKDESTYDLSTVTSCAAALESLKA